MFFQSEGLHFFPLEVKVWQFMLNYVFLMILLISEVARAFVISCKYTLQMHD